MEPEKGGCRKAFKGRKGRLRGFYFITDSGLSTASDTDSARQAVEGGAALIQYREKNLEYPKMLGICREIADICSGRVVFIVNDHVELARDCGADGVHIGQDDTCFERAKEMLGPDAVIGVTVHNLKEARRAVLCGADYLGASPIFETSTKKDAGKPAGIRLIMDIKAGWDIPVAAIGGIDHSNADKVINSGADMICAISQTVCEKDIGGAVRGFAKRFGPLQGKYISGADNQ